MRMRAAIKCLLSVGLLLILVFFTATVEAKGGGGGGGRSSGGSSRSSGYSNSGAKRAPSPPASGDSGQKSQGSTVPASPGYGNSATKPKPNSAEAPAKVPQSSLQKQTEKVVSKEQSAKALADHKAQRAKFTTPESTVASSPATQSAVLGKMGTGNQLPPITTYYETRRSFYGGNGYEPPPYMYRSRPSFGMWDAMALWFILDHFSNPRYSAMYYNHQDDPGMREWRTEAERLSQDNADLKAKLAGLDEKVAGMSNTPKDPSYVPDDMKETVLAANVAEHVLPQAAVADISLPTSVEKPKKSSHTLLYLMIGLGIVAGTIWLLRRARRA